MNRSYRNSGYKAMNAMSRDSKSHSSIHGLLLDRPDVTHHVATVVDCCDLLVKLPDQSVQLIVCDPSYNIMLADWDSHNDYIG